MEERDSLKTMLYCFARFGLFWLINVFAMIFGRTAILGVIGSAFPNLELYAHPILLSFFSWLIPAWLLTWIFWDDAKRHTAYGLYSLATVMLIVIITAAVFYAPALALQTEADPRVVAGITNLYFPFYWLSRIDDDPQVYGLLGVITEIALCVLSYLLSHKYYAKKFAELEAEEK